MIHLFRNGVRNVREWFHDRKFNSKNAQERLDTDILYSMLSYYRNTKRGYLDYLKSKNMKEEAIDNEMYEFGMISTLDYFEKREHNVHILDNQILEMFKHVHNIGGFNPYPKPIYKSNIEREKSEETVRMFNSKDIEVYNPGDDIIHPEGFSMVIKKSDIDHPESGYGVYVKGKVLPGTVLAFYPGTVYHPNDITKEIIEGNEYMYCRYDNIIIDGSKWDKRQEKYKLDILKSKYTGGTTKLSESIKKFQNSFGIANFVNHPPKGKQPNVLCYSYNFPNNFPSDYKPYIPNENAPVSSFMDVKVDFYMAGAVVVALRTIQDEELFLNYRFNPSLPYPDWYEQPDLDEAKRRWNGYF